jgi:hypothetical protein
MYEQNELKATKIEKLVARPGFAGRFHRVTFVWLDGGLVDSSFQVWVPREYPEANLERVARTFLWRRLLDFAELSKAGALAEQEIGAIRKSRSDSQRVVKATSRPHRRSRAVLKVPTFASPDLSWMMVRGLCRAMIWLLGRHGWKHPDDGFRTRWFQTPLRIKCGSARCFWA